MKAWFKFVCGVPPVRVVYGDGEVLYLPPLTTVEEVLLSYPHHFICRPGLNNNSDSSSNNNRMLHLDAELQSDCIYFLLPVPRMFPAAPFLSSQCRCYDEAPGLESHRRTLPCKSPLRVYSSPQRVGRLGSPLRGKSRRHMLKGSKSKVLPESSLYSAGREDAAALASSPPRPLWRNCPWRPRLSCISEEDDLELAMEELRYHGFLRKKQPSTNLPVIKPPASPRPPQLKPSKTSRIRAEAQIKWSKASAGVPTLITIC